MRKLQIAENSTIEMMSPELLFLGKSGQPYRGTLYIHFVSAGRTIELPDFKKYITSLRNKVFMAEDISREIYKTLWLHIGIGEGPKTKIGVVVDLTGRGGIQQTISHGEPFTPNRNKNKIFQL